MKNLLLKNATVITMNPAQPTVSEILISGGTIVKVGVDIDSGQSCEEVIDLGGRTILPAFWDAHVHFFQTGIREIEFDGGSMETETELFDALRDWIRNGNRVNGYGYSPRHNGDLPTRAQLDRINREIPLFLRRVDGHSSCFNTAMLEIIQERIIGMESADIKRGWLFGEAHILVEHFIAAQIDTDTLKRAAREVSKRALSVGCGTIVALVPKVDWMKLLLELDLSIQIVPRLETLNPREACELGLKRVGACMPMADGAFGSHSAFLFEEYSDRPGCFGKRGIADEKLDSWMAEAAKLGLSPAVHAIGDAAVEMVLRAVEKIPPDDRPLRARIEHAELLTDSQIERIADLGVSLAMQPVFDALWGGPDALYANRLGKRWRRLNRFRDILDAGITIAGSSDSYITPIDPLAGICAAINHSNPDQRVSAEEAISMFTTGAAKSEGFDDNFSSIEPGKHADLVVLDSDIRNYPCGAKVAMTIVGGEIKFNRSESDV